MRDTLTEVTSVEKAVTTIKKLLKNKIEKSEKNELLVVHDSLRKLLKGSRVFVDLGIEPALARGAIAEIMLEEMGKSWLMTNNIVGGVVGNVMLLLYPLTTTRDETTQLDVVIITDRAILVCECKSYKGEQKIIDNRLISKVMDAEPWKQNRNHIKTLKANLSKDLPDIKLPPMYNVVFLFSDGTLSEWEEPTGENERILLTWGGFTSLSEMYNGEKTVLDNNQIVRIKKYLSSKTPNIDEQVEHIKRLEEII